MKPGYKTSEFWLAAALLALSVGNMTDVLKLRLDEQQSASLMQASGIVAAAYAAGRGLAKTVVVRNSTKA